MVYEAIPISNVVTGTHTPTTWYPAVRPPDFVPGPYVPTETVTMPQFDFSKLVKDLSTAYPAPAPETNPKKLYGDKKVPVQLVPPALAIAAADALGEGAEKYGAYKWRETRVEALTYVGAILRHVYAYLDGEDIDPESTRAKSHLAGIAGSVAILLDATHGGFLIDNRPKRGPAPKMVLTPEEKPHG